MAESDEDKNKCVRKKKTVGKVIFCPCKELCFLGSGSYGKVYRGLYENRIKVAVKGVPIETVTCEEANILCCVDSHSNILRYYCTEDDIDIL